MKKVGTFDWITSYDVFKAIFDEMHLNELEKKSLNILVIGCGTSNLSFDLMVDGFHHIYSLDNDIGCIDFMKDKYSKEKDLHWFHYDIVTKEGEDKLKIDELTNQFDFVLDK